MSEQQRKPKRKRNASKKKRKHSRDEVQIIDGLPVDEFIRQNADPIWLLQNEMYAELSAWEQERDQRAGSVSYEKSDRDHIPF